MQVCVRPASPVSKLPEAWNLSLSHGRSGNTAPQTLQACSSTGWGVLLQTNDLACAFVLCRHLCAGVASLRHIKHA